MPGGRPVKFTPELQRDYLTLLSAGHGRRESAGLVGMSHRQVAAWRQSDEAFRKECEEAEAEANEPVVGALYAAAKRGEPWAVKLWLTNRDSGNWQERVQVDQTVTGTLNIEAPTVADILGLAGVLEERRLEIGPGAVDAESWEDSDAGSAEVSATPSEEPNLCMFCEEPFAEHTDAELRSCQSGLGRTPAFADRAGGASLVPAKLAVVVAQAVVELDAEHYPTWASPKAHEAGKDPIGCALCWPGDGSWPCSSRMIADDLRKALGEKVSNPSA